MLLFQLFSQSKPQLFSCELLTSPLSNNCCVLLFPVYFVCWPPELDRDTQDLKMLIIMRKILCSLFRVAYFFLFLYLLFIANVKWLNTKCVNICKTIFSKLHSSTKKNYLAIFHKYFWNLHNQVKKFSIVHFLPMGYQKKWRLHYRIILRI